MATPKSVDLFHQKKNSYSIYLSYAFDGLTNKHQEVSKSVKNIQRTFVITTVFVTKEFAVISNRCDKET